MKFHPIFGHTLANDKMFPHPLLLNAPVVHVKALIQAVEDDVIIHGVAHHHLLINNIEVITIHGEDESNVSDEAFVAIRYGDNMGLSGPIEGLEEGQEIELQGEYIDKNHVYESIGNPGDPVIHFTHHPVGFVIYKGIRYE
ncbi:hypothetical protein DNHGIG_28410 [Collibacillus ludicampi]|uniref:DUF3465 domain-containing protein n=1 Tax=Collibacillus ludicampi TaxID=2771369 RepID=A0AAV4LIP5_9BACL|nr:hypothetical protein [Collibacillus ludicampi]GIM47292.1 hypothetical protein DNHGIG_28410 [Collibacillus ludicampi]